MASTGAASRAWAKAWPAPAGLDAFVAKSGFSGVVLTGQRGRRHFVGAYGLVNIEARTPANPATSYAIGSVSKWMTTVAVLRLVDQGRLKLDRPITNYLASYRRDTGGRVSLRHLLSNASGIPDSITAAARKDSSLRQSSASAAEVVLRYGMSDLVFEPGAKFDYSMTNWAILRALLEERIGEPFPVIIQRLVLAPLRLRYTGIAEHGFEAVRGLAVAYGSSQPMVRKMDGAPAFAAAAGTFFSNADDMLRAAYGVYSSGLLSSEALAELTRIHVPEEDYALGGRVRVIGGQRWAWEMGRIGGYRSHIAHALEDQRTIVFLCNNDLNQSDISSVVERLALG